MCKQVLAAGLVLIALPIGTQVASAQSNDESATKIQGRLYADFTSKEIKDDGTGTKSSDSGIGTDVKRFYFTVTHKINSTWSAQFQSDIGDHGAKRYDVFVKKAYLQGHFSDALTVRLGSADTPWIPFAEGQYGMRYLENTITDSLGLGTSADWGVHVLGKLAGGKVGYQVSAINGRGYSDPTRSNSVDFEGRIDFEPVQGLTLAVGGYSGKLGKDTATASPALHTATRTQALVNWKSGPFGIGGEWFEAKNFKNVTTPETDKADGYSIWAHYAPAESLTIFARYDDAKPSKDLAPGKTFTYYNVGIQKQFNRVFAGSLAYKYAEVKGGSQGTSNGTIGSSIAGAKGKYNEVGVWVVYNF